MVEYNKKIEHFKSMLMIYTTEGICPFDTNEQFIVSSDSSVQEWI